MAVKSPPFSWEALAKKYEPLTKGVGLDSKEIKELLYATLILGVVLSSGNWGLVQFIVATFVVFFSYTLHHVSYKWHAKRYNAYTKYEFCWRFALLVFLIGIFSEARVIIPVVGGAAIMTPRLYRPGRAFPFLGPKERARIMAIGPLISVFLALFARALIGVFGNNLLLVDLFRFNVWLAAISMLPLTMVYPSERFRKYLEAIIPTFPGAMILFGDKSLYVFLLSFVFISLALVNYVSILTSILIAIILALLIWIEFFRRFKESIF